jgi:hypothetical protein
VVSVSDAMKNRAIPAVAAACLLSACSERTFSHFPTAEQARASGVFERGWLPRELEGARDIFLCGDLDTNEVWARVRVTAGLRLALASRLPVATVESWTVRKPKDLRCWDQRLVGAFDAARLHELGWTVYTPDRDPWPRRFIALAQGEEVLTWSSGR